MSLEEILRGYMTERLQQIIISGVKKEFEASKIRVRPVCIRDQIKFQCSMTVGTKEIHKNYDREEIIQKILEWMEYFRQLQFDHVFVKAHVLVSKKGKETIKLKRIDDSEQEESDMNIALSHNRTKNYIMQEGTPVSYLIDLGVMTKEGEIVHAKYDKFKQINRFLEFIEDILPKLAKDREVTILDFGCGKSYLTFAMYHYLKVMKGYDVNIIGLDLKEDVIVQCNSLSKKYGYDKLNFYIGDIASYEGVSNVDMVVTLHACDTATDYALGKAVEWGAKVILSVPCCQHELNGQIYNEILEPIFSYGILKERMAAIFTDGLRAKMLESKGYDTQILEFIDMEHTPKNLLIRAIKEDKCNESKCAQTNKELRACMEFIHAAPTLEKLLFQQET